MAYTSHGHQIPGTDVEPVRPIVARCGGPSLCKECAAEAWRVQFENSPLEMFPEQTQVLNGDVEIHKIPDAPWTEEQLRYEALRLAVERCQCFSTPTDRILQYAEEFREYIRPTK
jgi:hypothetical protein